jgi:hypothetical protein
MTRLFLIAFFLFAATAFADDCDPEQYQSTQSEVPFLIYTDNSQLRLLVADRHSADWPIGQCYVWEGHSSHFKLIFGSDKDDFDFTMTWHLDIVGPDWLDVAISQKRNSTISVEASRYSIQTQPKWKFDHQYCGTGELFAEKDDIRLVIQSLLRRMHQGRILDLQTIREYNFGMEPVCDAGTEAEEIALIGQLNDDNWRVRDAATRKLSERKYLVHLDRLSRNLKLSPEQQCRIDSIFSAYNLATTKDLQAKLAQAAHVPEGRVLVDDR